MLFKEIIAAYNDSDVVHEEGLLSTSNYVFYNEPENNLALCLDYGVEETET
jgi:hypothetical protein